MGIISICIKQMRPMVMLMKEMAIFPPGRSIDLVNWEYMNAVFPEAPSWIKDSLNNMRANMGPALEPIGNRNYGFWAPHVNKVGSVYRLYTALW